MWQAMFMRDCWLGRGVSRGWKGDVVLWLFDCLLGVIWIRSGRRAFVGPRLVVLCKTK